MQWEGCRCAVGRLHGLSPGLDNGVGCEEGLQGPLVRGFWDMFQGPTAGLDSAVGGALRPIIWSGLFSKKNYSKHQLMRIELI